jgi:hypothetical protein
MCVLSTFWKWFLSDFCVADSTAEKLRLQTGMNWHDETDRQTCSEEMIQANLGLKKKV